MWISTLRNDDGSIEIYFTELSCWDMFKRIMGILAEEKECEVLEVIERDMITDSAIDVLYKLGETIFTLRHDDMLGNRLYMPDAQHKAELERLAEDVLKKVRYRQSG